MHNFVVHSKGLLANTIGFGPVNMTQFGALAGLVGILGERFGYIVPNAIISDVLKGAFAEGFNVPAVESISRTGAAGGGQAGGYGWGSAAVAQSPTGIGPAGYIPVWAYT